MLIKIKSQISKTKIVTSLLILGLILFIPPEAKAKPNAKFGLGKCKISGGKINLARKIKIDESAIYVDQITQKPVSFEVSGEHVKKNGFITFITIKGAIPDLGLTLTELIDQPDTSALLEDIMLFVELSEGNVESDIVLINDPNDFDGNPTEVLVATETTKFDDKNLLLNLNAAFKVSNSLVLNAGDPAVAELENVEPGEETPEGLLSNSVNNGMINLWCSFTNVPIKLK